MKCGTTTKKPISHTQQQIARKEKTTTTTVQLLRLFLRLFLFLRELVWFAAACSSADAEEKKGERKKTLGRRQSVAKPRPRHQHR